jgi:PPOX class probable F420-dependent enzyme
MLGTVTELNAVWSLAAKESFLAVVSIVRANGTVHSSLVNAGPCTHPISGEPVVGYVTYGKVKLSNLRARPASSLSYRSGWKYATIEGTCEIIGPDDPAEGIDDERLRLLLREVYAGAGGRHDDLEVYDRVMREERRAAVLMTPDRVYGNA